MTDFLVIFSSGGAAALRAHPLRSRRPRARRR